MECHNRKPQPFPDTKRKRKQTNPNKRKSNKRTKSTKISSLFPKRGNSNAERTEKHKNKITQDKTLNKSPRRINHKATKSKTHTGTTALERSVEQTTGGGGGGGLARRGSTIALNPPVVCSTDRSKAVVPVLVLLLVALWLSYEAICCSLSVCHFVLVFSSPFSIAITSLGAERANLSAFRTFVLFVLV